MTYTPEVLEQLADRHDAHSVCTWPAKDHFAEVCREYAALLRAQTSEPARDLPVGRPTMSESKAEVDRTILDRIADATADDAIATLRENMRGRRDAGEAWQRTPNRHARLRSLLAEAVESLPVRHCREDPTGVVLVNVSQGALLSLLGLSTPPGSLAGGGSDG